MSWNMVNLKVKLSFLSLYFASSVYIFAKFASSFLYTWMPWVCLFDGVWEKLFVDTLLIEVVGLMMGGMKGDTIPEKSGMRVFLSLQLIRYELNAPSVNRYSWMSVSVYCVGSSSCKALNRDLAMASLDFFIQTPRLLRWESCGVSVYCCCLQV